MRKLAFSLVLAGTVVLGLVFLSQKSENAAHANCLKEGNSDCGKQIPPWCVMHNNMKTKIWAFAFSWNEEALLPYYIHHYSLIAEKIVIFDEHSTDRTREIAAKCPKVEVRTNVAHKLDDAEHNTIRDNAWKEARGKADFVVFGDMDEFIYADEGLDTFLQGHLTEDIFETRPFTMLHPCGMRCLSLDVPLTDQVIFGSKASSMYAKNLLFSPNILISFAPGGHSSSIRGKHTAGTGTLKILHYKFAFGYDFQLARNDAIAKRISEINRAKGWGGHVTQTNNEFYVKNLFSRTWKTLAQVLPQPSSSQYRPGLRCSDMKTTSLNASAVTFHRYIDVSGTVYLPPAHYNWVTTQEKHVLRFFENVRCFNNSSVVVDVGMNDGTYSILAAKRGCRVISFELQTQCISLSCLTLQLNDLSSNVNIYQRPVSDTDSKEYFLDTNRECSLASGTFGLHHAVSKKDSSTETLFSTTLDAALRFETQIEFLKLDIEGHEPQALFGAMSIFEKKGD